MLKWLMAAIGAAALASCTASSPPEPARPETRTFPHAPAEAAPPAYMPPAGTYRIDSSQSELRVLVYKAGALASLGHNHVIQNHSVNGSIDVAPTLAGSSFTFSAAVEAFVVDDAQARAEEGAEFPGEVSDSAKLGTWNNMMRAEVLNAAQNPMVSLRSIRVEELEGVPTATVDINVAGHESSALVPFVLKKEAYGLSANAAFDLNQSALGMTPYSLMLGALTVRDTMTIKLKIIAVLEAPRLGAPAR